MAWSQKYTIELHFTPELQVEFMTLGKRLSRHYICPAPTVKSYITLLKHTATYDISNFKKVLENFAATSSPFPAKFYLKFETDESAVALSLCASSGVLEFHNQLSNALIAGGVRDIEDVFHMCYPLCKGVEDALKVVLGGVVTKLSGFGTEIRVVKYSPVLGRREVCFTFPLGGPFWGRI